MRAQPTEGGSSPTGRRRQESGARQTVRSNPAVLVVDDDFDILTSMQQILVDAGYATAVAQTGEDALALLQSGVRPSLIVVDLMLPGMDGWELVRAIRELGSVGATIVSMTAGDRLMEAPVSAAYFQKPVRWDELLRTVARHCGAPRSSKPPPPDAQH